MEKTAVVILNWNGKTFLERFLPNVIQYSPEATVYVADNCSTDDSVQYLQSTFPSVKIIRNPCNEGFSRGYNLALQQIDATYYVLLNSDVEVTPNWLRPLIELMNGNPEIGACQPKIKSYHHRDMFEYAGAAGGFIDKLGYPFCRGRIFNHLEKDHGQYNDLMEIFWATGACMFVRAEAYHQAEGLDEDFFAHMEEIDLCWRMQRSGWRIYYCGTSEVFHVGGGSLSKSNPHKTYLNFRNNIALLVKNLPSRRFWPKLFLRFMLDGLAGIKFLFSEGFGHFISVIRAHLYIYQNIHTLKTKRKNLKRLNAPVSGVYPHSIALEYYIGGKKTFSDLKFRMDLIKNHR